MTENVEQTKSSLSSLKVFLQEHLTEARRIFNTPGAKKPVTDRYDVIIQVLEMVLVAIHKIEKGETDMEGIKLGLGKIGKIEEIPVTKKGIDAAIIEFSKTIPPGHQDKVDPSAVKWISFRNRVYTLRKTGELPKNFKPLRVGEDYYLVHHKTVEPNRRGRR